MFLKSRHTYKAHKKLYSHKKDVNEINQPRSVKLKIKGHKLKSGMNWQGA
jgi:hypothetical protein